MATGVVGGTKDDRQRLPMKPDHTLQKLVILCRVYVPSIIHVAFNLTIQHLSAILFDLFNVLGCCKEVIILSILERERNQAKGLRSHTQGRQSLILNISFILLIGKSSMCAYSRQ